MIDLMTSLETWMYEQEVKKPSEFLENFVSKPGNRYMREGGS